MRHCIAPSYRACKTLCSQRHPEVRSTRGAEQVRALDYPGRQASSGRQRGLAHGVLSKGLTEWGPTGAVDPSLGSSVSATGTARKSRTQSKPLGLAMRGLTSVTMGGMSISHPKSLEGQGGQDLHRYTLWSSTEASPPMAWATCLSTLAWGWAPCESTPASCRGHRCHGVEARWSDGDRTSDPSPGAGSPLGRWFIL